MTTGQERRADLDWTRLALLLAAIVYRSARSWALGPASRGDWAVALLLGDLPDIVELCSIGLFLLLSGGCIRAALEHQGAGEFVLARVLRLFVPLVSGALLLSPPQVYLELRGTAGLRSSFPEFLAQSFQGFYGLTPGGSFAFHGFHLAYLLLLLVLSVALLPLFIALRRHMAARRRPPPVASGRGRTAAHSAALLLALSLLPAAPIGALGAPVGALVAAPIALLGGFVLLGSAELERCLRRSRLATIVFGAALVAASVAFSGTPRAALRGVGAWTLALGLFAFGLHAFSRLPPQPAALREMGLPFFILSRPVVVALGYLLRGLTIATGLRAALVIALSLACLVGSSLAVRRSNLLRFLFGLLPLPRHDYPGGLR